MLDIKKIRENREHAERLLRSKDPSIDLTELLRLDEEVRDLKQRGESIKAEQNQLSKEIGLKKRAGEEACDAMERVAHLSELSHILSQQLHEIESSYRDELSRLPNFPMEDLKVSHDPADNVIVKEHGVRPSFDFAAKNHLELNERLGLFDFERGAKISGRGWPVYRGMGARLEWALLNYMISIHVKNGFEQWIPPMMVRREAMFGAGQLPKFDNQQFKIEDEDYHLYLIPTAEVSLNALHSGEILQEEQLPLRYVAYTPCFRREAGAAGSQERGLIRTHQFNKVEMFAFTTPETSNILFDELVAAAEEVVRGLGLHYRLSLLVTGDASFAGARTIDLEVWLPGQNRYYEVSSISNCTDFQARRSAIRFRREGGGKPELLHTLNGSGVATSRLMVALLENGQREDGSVLIPEVLRPILGVEDVLRPQDS